MGGLDANTIIGVAIGTVITAVIAHVRRYLSRTRFWTGISQTAAGTLLDPNNPIQDPIEATERALVEAQATEVHKVARKVSSSVAPPMGAVR